MFISRTTFASASARSTLDRMARWSSSSETRPESGEAWTAGNWPLSPALRITRAGGGGVAGAGLAGTALLSTLAKAWATTSGTEAGSRPFSLRLYLTAMAASISCTTATNVSRTPSPRAATAGKALRPQRFRARFKSASGWAPGRSCLLYWMTSGTFSGTSRFARRLTFMFSKADWFSLSAAFWLSATNTTASAPARTTRRVALYWTWPGTV